LKLLDSYVFLERLRELIYELLEYRDRVKEDDGEIIPFRRGTPLVKYGFISMLKGGVIMDVTIESLAPSRAGMEETPVSPGASQT